MDQPHPTTTIATNVSASAAGRQQRSLGRRRTPSSFPYSVHSLVLVVLIGIVCFLQILLFQPDTSIAYFVSSSSRTTITRYPSPDADEDFAPTNATTPKHRNNPRKRRWAYVFLLADCDPTAPQPAYRGTFYNILAATYVLKHHDTTTTTTTPGSTTTGSRSSGTTQFSQAEIVVLVQMAATTLPAQRLTKEEEALFQSLNISIRYLPHPSTDHQNNIVSPTTFYQLVMAKFHVLTMVEYTKVLFLDGDVLPLCNLDYLLELSDKGQQGNDNPPHLGDTVLHAMYDDPVNAGLFVVTPQQQLHQQLQQETPNEEESWDKSKAFREWKEFRELPPDQRPHVDYRLWMKSNTKDGGHKNADDNNDVFHQKEGSGWDFYCADSDQGFLLYWSLFLNPSQSLSIIVGPTVEQYDAILPSSSTASSSFQQGNTTSSRVARRPSRVVSSHFLSDYSCLPPSPSSPNLNPRAHTWAQNANAEAAQWPFYQDFYHMVGYSKAWESFPSSSTSTTDKNSPPLLKQQQEQQEHSLLPPLGSSRDYWYYILQQVADRFDPNHTVIPHPLYRLSEMVGKPKLRGDLFSSIPNPTMKTTIP